MFESDAARTFDFQAGDVGYIPGPDGHYIENIGTEPLHLLEILVTSEFQDLSMGQWLALTVSLTSQLSMSAVLISIAVTSRYADSQHHSRNLQHYLRQLQEQALPCELGRVLTLHS